jgi:hypothetical protein
VTAGTDHPGTDLTVTTADLTVPGPAVDGPAVDTLTVDGRTVERRTVDQRTFDQRAFDEPTVDRRTFDQRTGSDRRLAGAGPDAQLINTLHSLRELSRFADAAALVRAADARGAAGAMSMPAHAAAGPALAAVSEYGPAGVHLLLASTEPALAPEALGRLAELAWIEHDHGRGQAYALAGLTLDPSHHLCRIQLHRNENATTPEPSTTGHVRLTQAGVFADPQGSAGDRVLGDAVRRIFTGGPAAVADAGSPAAGDPVDWSDVHVHQLFDETRLAEVNRGDGLIVGGGGLFVPDVAPNGNSGWQWNVADDVLARIDVPLVVFGVGYALFEGQTFEGSRFERSLRTLVERAAFVGLRSQGSVDRVRELLPDHLAERVVWQPCPTTIAPDAPDAGDGTGPVLLNCAYDRAGRRFGNGYGTFLAALRDWVVDTRERADVRYVAHCVDDERFVSDLRREHGLTLPVIALYDLTPDQIREQYRQARLVVGMRAGTVPFGCGTPIISLLSHPEPGWFLTDIDRPQWGIGVHDPHLAGRLSELTSTLLDSGPAVTAEIRRIRTRLADITSANLRSLPPSFDPARRLRQDETDE